MIPSRAQVTSWADIFLAQIRAFSIPLDNFSTHAQNWAIILLFLKSEMSVLELITSK